jgi:hypothetical protein
MYIVVVAFLALSVPLAPASSVSFVPALFVFLVLVSALFPRFPGSSLICFNGSESRLIRFPGFRFICFPGSVLSIPLVPALSLSLVLVPALSVSLVLVPAVSASLVPALSVSLAHALCFSLVLKIRKGVLEAFFRLWWGEPQEGFQEGSKIQFLQTSQEACSEDKKRRSGAFFRGSWESSRKVPKRTEPQLFKKGPEHDTVVFFGTCTRKTKPAHGPFGIFEFLLSKNTLEHDTVVVFGTCTRKTEPAHGPLGIFEFLLSENTPVHDTVVIFVTCTRQTELSHGPLGIF